MNKYTEKDVAQSDELMNKLIHKYKKFYVTKKDYNLNIIKERKIIVSERNKNIKPIYDENYYCGTCGSTDGSENPNTAYCFHCDTDNWINIK